MVHTASVFCRFVLPDRGIVHRVKVDRQDLLLIRQVSHVVLVVSRYGASIVLLRCQLSLVMLSHLTQDLLTIGLLVSPLLVVPEDALELVVELMPRRLVRQGHRSQMVLLNPLGMATAALDRRRNFA